MMCSYFTKRTLISFLILTLTTSVFWTSFGCGGGTNSTVSLTPEPAVEPQAPQKGVVLYINDHLGNAHLITDSQGNILREESRYPYGLDWRVDGSDVTTADYVYTGKEYDEETGLVYFGGRYYSPEMGRWITPDPLFLNSPTEATKRPLENNLYSYTVNNPINYVDPNGEWVQIALAVAAVGLMFASDAPGGVDLANANFTTAVLPYVNDYRDLYEVTTGKDLITKSKLSLEDRLKSGFGLFVAGSGALFRGASEFARMTDELPGDVKFFTGTLRVDEWSALEAVANKYNTTFILDGSRGLGMGRNVYMDIPVGKGPYTRSDIDLRIDNGLDIKLGGAVSGDLKNVGGGGVVNVRSILDGGKYDYGINIKIGPTK